MTIKERKDRLLDVIHTEKINAILYQPLFFHRNLPVLLLYGLMQTNTEEINSRLSVLHER